MLFGRASSPDNFGKWVGVVLAVGLAILGFGYWSLLYGAITGTAIGGVSQVAWSLLKEPKWRPRLAFDPAIARSLMRFGQFVMLAGFADYIARSMAASGNLLSYRCNCSPRSASSSGTLQFAATHSMRWANLELFSLRPGSRF